MDRYPELEEECIDEMVIIQEEMVNKLGLLYSKLTTQFPVLDSITNDLQSSKDINSLRRLCAAINEIMPMQTKEGELFPLLSTGEQLNKYLEGETEGLGDCKLLTIFTTYICSAICHIPIVVSIRSYSGHPVLYVELDNSAYRVSYLHANPDIRIFTDDNPFEVSREPGFNAIFLDREFNDSRSVLYWRVTDAIYVLDCMNLMRRSVVNYVFNPDKYSSIFTKAQKLLQNSGIYFNSILFHWESEMDRVKFLLETYPNYWNNKDKFKEIIIKSLRF